MVVPNEVNRFYTLYPYLGMYPNHPMNTRAAELFCYYISPYEGYPDTVSIEMALLIIDMC